MAHRLTSLHDEENKIIFDNIIIVTDRVVVDRQLQKAIMGMEHKAGLIRVMDDKCNSADLAIALNGNTKIIATTIQKFPYIVDSVKGLKNKSFAVIIDEAHSSTAGKDMAAVTMSLGSGDQTESDVEDMISSEIKRNGKQANVSIFAFTATPKPTTIQLFGRLNTHGQREAFHVYSMKQAIEDVIEHSELKGIEIAPGTFANIGYLNLLENKPDQAIAYFKKEKQLYPEATIFMDRMIQKVEAQTGENKDEVEEKGETNAQN